MCAFVVHLLGLLAIGTMVVALLALAVTGLTAALVVPYVAVKEFLAAARLVQW